MPALMVASVKPHVTRHPFPPRRGSWRTASGRCGRRRALAWLKSQGGILSLSFLNSFGVGGPGAAFTKDMPTEVFSRVGENFIRLLRGEIVWDASTSPVF